MATSAVGRYGRIEFSFAELTGALGDSITVLPVVVALGALTSLSLPHALLGFAFFQVVWGVRYGLPVSVEPMKALAGLAIAGAIGYGELVTGGLLAGVVLLGAGRAGALTHLQRYIDEPVVRGVQFAVALLLAVTGLELAAGTPRLAALGAGVALAATLIHRRAGALAVLGAGTAVALAGGVPPLRVPAMAAFPAGGPRLTAAAMEGLTGQLAMTVGNAAVATSLLLSDLFDADISADDLAESMGAMNLAAVPLGGVPMCHGSGGLAGKYAFGARTGGANLVLGVLYAGAALVAGVWTGFPMAMLGILLVAVAGQLALVALDSNRRWLVVTMGGFAVFTNVGVAFVTGLAVSNGISRLR